MTLEQWSDYFSDWCNGIEVVFWETKAANTRRELSKSAPTYYAKITKTVRNYCGFVVKTLKKCLKPLNTI